MSEAHAQCVRLKGSAKVIEFQTVIFKARWEAVEECRWISEARLREMEELVLMSFKGSAIEMEEFQRMIFKAGWEAMEEYKRISESRMREMEERVLMSFKGSPIEMEEFLRMILKAGLEAMEEYKRISEARLREMEERVLMSFKGSPIEMEEFQRMTFKARWGVIEGYKRISKARLREMAEYKRIYEDRLREMEERVLMSLKDSPIVMEEFQRIIFKARWEAVEEYKRFYEAKLREIEERVLMSFKRSRREMEEFQRMIFKARWEAMKEYRWISEARLRKMEEHVLMSLKGNRREMEEFLKMTFNVGWKAMEEYGRIAEARLREMEKRVLMSFKGSPVEMEEFQLMIFKASWEVVEEYRTIFEARLRDISEQYLQCLVQKCMLMSFKGSRSKMEEWRSISVEKWRQMEASDVKEGKGDKKTIDDEGKKHGGNEGKEDGRGAEAETEVQGSDDKDLSGRTSERTEEDLSHEIHEVQLKDQEETNKVALFKGTVSSEGFHLDLDVGAIHLTFPPNTVAEPTDIMVYRWKDGVCLPQLTEHEAVVSNVIEISPAPEVGSLKFNNEVKVVLSHSAAGLEGYELVMKRLCDTEKNEWEEIAGCDDIRQVSDIEDNHPCPNNVPYSFPVVQAGITECSTYAVVSRLKLSPTYTITGNGGTFAHPDYPQVTITVPQKAVETETRLSLGVKVQEVPQDEFQCRNLFCGPIIRVLCSPRVTFLEPVTIQLPVSLGNKLVNIPQPSECRVRIFFRSPERETKEWVEISDKLEHPASYDGKLVKFKVQRFSGYAFLLDWTVFGSGVVSFGIIAYLWSIISNQPLVANFFGYFDPRERLGSRNILFLICCPAHRSKDVKQELEKAGLTPSEATSRRDMIPGRDKAFVFLSGGINFASSKDMGGFYLRFDGNVPHKGHLQVRQIDDKVHCQVEFRDTPDTTKDNNLLSTLSLRFSSSNIDRQVSSVSNASVTPLKRALLGCSISTFNRKLKLTLLSSEWGSTKGGLSTINRELAIQLAKEDNVEVCMYLPWFSDEDKKAAADCGVSLLKAKEMPGHDDPIDWLASIPRDHQIDVVIGHGIHLGRQVPLIKETHPECKWVQVVHTDPEELGMFKNHPNPTAKGEKKYHAEVKLCQEADLVVAVGPKLADSFSCYLRYCQKDQEVLDLTPGILSEFDDVNQATKERSLFRVLVFGRGDCEDFNLKGYDIAARAVAELKEPFKLVFVGAPYRKEEKLKKKLLKEGISPHQLTVRSAKDREQLAQQFYEADLVIMPSRTEGFGLVALEALSAGLPVLVSRYSGLGEALEKVRFGSHFVVNSDNPTEWAKRIRAVHSKDRKVRLKEASELRKNYSETYKWEEQCSRLIEKILELVGD